jgi:hypothetical protein
MNKKINKIRKGKDKLSGEDKLSGLLVYLICFCSLGIGVLISQNQTIQFFIGVGVGVIIGMFFIIIFDKFMHRSKLYINKININKINRSKYGKNK